MHAVGDSVDYKHSDDVTPNFGNDGYTYLLQYQFNELDESQMLDNFFFRSSEDRESFEQANAECGVEYLLATKSYDERLYHLCMVIRSDWFCNNKNLWNLAGFFARQPHSDWYLMRKTFLCVLKQKVEHFNKECATKEFEGWFNSKYHPSLNEGNLKGIAAGCDSVAYKQWKDEYEVNEPRKTPKGTPSLPSARISEFLTSPQLRRRIVALILRPARFLDCTDTAEDQTYIPAEALLELSVVQTKSIRSHESQHGTAGSDMAAQPALERPPRLHTFSEHAGVVSGVAFHPGDDNALASCSFGRSVNLWDPGRHLHHDKAHDAGATSVSFYPTGNDLLSTSLDGTIKLWDVREGQVLYTLQGHDGAANCAEFSPDCRLIASGGGGHVRARVGSQSRQVSRSGATSAKSGGDGRSPA